MLIDFVIGFIVAFLIMLVLNKIAYLISKIQVRTFKWVVHSAIGACIISAIFLVV